MSRPKTEYLCLNKQDAAGTIQMQGEDLNRVKQFKYLGLTVKADGGSEKEVIKRVQTGWGAWKKITVERKAVQGYGEAGVAIWYGNSGSD